MPNPAIKKVGRRASQAFIPSRDNGPTEKWRVLTLFGTRPEVIKLAPVIREMERSESIRTINVASGQHQSLVDPFIEYFHIRVDFNLKAMTVSQDQGTVLHRIIEDLRQLLIREKPDLIVVQGDTTTALAGALAGHSLRIPVAHVEAGLRSGNIFSPFPEELNRIRISQLADCHFAATTANRNALLREGVAPSTIFVTGNPIVDALQIVLQDTATTENPEFSARVKNRRLIVFTAHRRESFGRILKENLCALRKFVRTREDVVVVFPVHPNPQVRISTNEILADEDRILLMPPMPYPEFIHLLSQSWLVVSDSGGIQEEVPSLGKPLLILRENTERPECVKAGFARLVGGNPEALMTMLEEAYQVESWANSIHKTTNPFGQGDSAVQIVNHLAASLEDRLLSMGTTPKSASISLGH